MLKAVGVKTAVDGVNDPAVDVCILGTDLQDLLPWSCVLWNTYLIHTLQEHGSMFIHIKHSDVCLCLLRVEKIQCS